MLQSRLIPCLLIKEGGFVKTTQFKNPVYLGDPINIINIFNEKGVDELIILDITKTKESKNPDFKLIERIASEAFVPLSYGGGIQTVDEAQKILSSGFEKIVVNTKAILKPDFVSHLSEVVGTQSVIVSIDVKKNIFGHYHIYTHAGSRKIDTDLVKTCQLMEKNGAGEILLNVINKDGMMNGYDNDLISKISSQISIPLIAIGGAESLNDFKQVIKSGAHAAAAGSFFVFQGKHKAVLISYPNEKEVESIQGGNL